MSDSTAGAVECWGCGKRNDGYTGIGHSAVPAAGDIGVCVYCRAVSVYTGDGVNRRPPTWDELAELEEDPRIPGAVVLATHVHRSMQAWRN